MKKLLYSVIGILLIAAALAGAYFYVQYQGRQKVTPDMLMTRLENSSECTTQKMIYNGVVESESGNVPLLTKETFLMTYKATVRAGFDISKTKIDVADERITVTIPEIVIQEVTIDPNEIKTYNTSLTLFKPDGKEALKDALIAAEDDAKKKAGESGLLEAAGENAEAVIKGLLADSAGDREIVVKRG